MITKREAERLVKSFLDESKPPSLPENFSFEVQHKCYGYGCRGKFFPSRYNSSRAKCICCLYCNMYFSPNKFIFHYHELPGLSYVPSNNLNFNSWRKHITLANMNSDESLNSIWEDVKSIFNSGKRKKGVSFYSESCFKRNSIEPKPSSAEKPKNEIHKQADRIKSKSNRPKMNIEAEKMAQDSMLQSYSNNNDVNMSNRSNLNEFEKMVSFINLMNPVYMQNTFHLTRLFTDLFAQPTFKPNYLNQNSFGLNIDANKANECLGRPYLNEETQVVHENNSNEICEQELISDPNGDQFNFKHLNKPIKDEKTEKKKKFFSIIDHIEEINQ